MWFAEDAARELPNLSLNDALQLVHLYADTESPKYERAALRWLGRYLAEDEPTLHQFAESQRPWLGTTRQHRSHATDSNATCPQIAQWN